MKSTPKADEIQHCYRVLELEPNASAEQLKQAYRELVKFYHPDRFPNDPKQQQRGNEKLKKINEAYETLSKLLATAAEQQPKAEPTRKRSYTQPKQPHPEPKTRPTTPRPSGGNSSGVKSEEDVNRQRKRFETERAEEALRQARVQKKKFLTIISAVAAVVVVSIIYAGAVKHIVRSGERNVGITLAQTNSDQADGDAANGFATNGVAKIQKGDLEGALADFNSAIELNPDNAEAYIGRGLVHSIKNDFYGAIANYTKAIELNPDNSDTYRMRGTEKEIVHDMDGALTDYIKAIELNPKDAQAYSGRGNVRKSKGDLSGAIEDYTKSIELKPDYLAYASRGAVKYEKGDFDGAISDSTKAIELKSEFSQAYIVRGLAKWKSGDLEGTLADSNMAEKLNPGNTEALKLLIKVKARMSESAQTNIGSVVTIASLSGKVYAGIKIIGDEPDGILYAYTNANIAGGGKILFSNLPELWRTKYNYSKEVAEAYEEHLRENAAAGAALYNSSIPYDIIEDYNNRGLAKYNNGDLDGAQAEFNKAIELNPFVPKSYYNSSRVKEARGDVVGSQLDKNKAVYIEQTIIDDRAQTKAKELMNSPP